MSNKTPTNQPNETESELSSHPSGNMQRSPKRLLVATAIILFGIYILYSGVVGLLENKSRLVTPSGAIIIETVEEPKKRQLGLSGRSSIGEDEGMLFVFDTAKPSNCFWMKDMQFALDMIWLDNDKKVVTVEESVEPSTFPESFCPDSAAKYGLEIQSNRAAALGIVVGEQLSF